MTCKHWYKYKDPLQRVMETWALSSVFNPLHISFYRCLYVIWYIMRSYTTVGYGFRPLWECSLFMPGGDCRNVQSKLFWPQFSHIKTFLAPHMLFCNIYGSQQFFNRKYNFLMKFRIKPFFCPTFETVEILYAPLHSPPPQHI